MCVAAIAWRADPRWLLVVIGNRDEWHRRPAAPITCWENGILAGRDLEAGGTWLGLMPGHRRFALVTNRRAESYPRPGMMTRGALITDWLLARPLVDTARMNPFNLIAAGPDGLDVMTNFPAPQHCKLAPGIHTLSNGGLDEAWFKERQLAAALASWLTAGKPPGVLLETLADPSPDPEQSANEYASVFIANPAYGTRCSTVIAVDAAGQGTMIERSFGAVGTVTGTVTIDFDWS